MQLKKWDEVPEEQVNPLLTRKLLCGKSMMVAHIFLKKGGVVPTHQHENEQITQVLSGCLRFWMGERGEEKVFEIHPGDVLIIPPMVPHKAEALEDTLDMDVFSPIRSDWLDGSDHYLREP